jgi:hypothetical protein
MLEWNTALSMIYHSSSKLGVREPLGVRQKLRGIQEMSNFTDVFQFEDPRILKGCKPLIYQKKVIFELSSFLPFF